MICSNCGKLCKLKCSICTQSFYCDRECQTAHWSVHQTKCNPKVSVIIPTYNRFQYLLNAISSIKSQTYKNIEIIVVNDKSTQPEYYAHDFGDIQIIHLPENTKQLFGYACAGYVRNIGIARSTGKYIAFCDDDDIWFPDKVEKQIIAMKTSGCRMSCTEGFHGNGQYNPNLTYPKYNKEYHLETIQNIYIKNNSNLMNNGYPSIWTFDFLRIHNCVITSSVIVEKQLVKYVNGFPCINRAEYYSLWLKLLQYTNAVYVDEPLFYYDGNHGDGQLY